MFVVATVITLASCSQDDEYYEDGLFTRADEMMTRSGGNREDMFLSYHLNPILLFSQNYLFIFLFIMNLKMKRLFVMLILQDIQ